MKFLLKILFCFLLSTSLALAGIGGITRYQGQVLQEVIVTDVGSTTTSTTLVNINAGNISILPKSNNSTLLVSVVFYGTITFVSTGVTNAFFQIFDVTNSALVGSLITLGTAGSGAAGVALNAPCTVQARVTNNVLTNRSFQLQAKESSTFGTPTAGGQIMTWSIREIQN